jgi:UDP:flavonoid glycosyltransferase YjiC (YdhE family)
MLERVDAVICHGGTGTTTGPLMRGIPVVVIPRGADQFTNAEHIERLSAGVLIPPDRQEVNEIARALANILSDPIYRHAAQRIPDNTAHLPDLDSAIDLFERLATATH